MPIFSSRDRNKRAENSVVLFTKYHKINPNIVLWGNFYRYLLLPADHTLEELAVLFI